jgi:hypothetical protein
MSIASIGVKLALGAVGLSVAAPLLKKVATTIFAPSKTAASMFTPGQKADVIGGPGLSSWFPSPTQWLKNKIGDPSGLEAARVAGRYNQVSSGHANRFDLIAQGRYSELAPHLQEGTRTMDLVRDITTNGFALTPSEQKMYDEIEDPKQKRLFLLQKQMQWQSMLFQALSNMANMRHEAGMTAVRNLRA